MSDAKQKFFCSGRPWEPAGRGRQGVAVLMSGGVDSSVAAAMLQRAGRDVVGVTMQIPSGISPRHADAQLESRSGQGAAEAARQLGIPHYFLDVRDEFRQSILQPFRQAYRHGFTPSPCIDCNARMKFGVVMRLVRQVLCVEQIATGHYARIAERHGQFGLYAAADTTNDQSYFLYGIKRDDLKNILFPLGGQTTQRTRELAASYGLDAARARSVELCFAGQGNYRVALGAAPDAGPGDVLDLRGNVIGRHKGISHYTVGQRHGLGIAASVPLYVVRIDPERNTITLGDRAAAGTRTVSAHKVNVLAPQVLDEASRLLGRVRSTGTAEPCTVAVRKSDRTDGDSAIIDAEFDRPRQGVAPGQHLVLYSERSRVVAGGEILRPSRECT